MEIISAYVVYYSSINFIGVALFLIAITLFMMVWFARYGKISRRK